MKRRDRSEFRSLVDLLEENTPAKKLSVEQKNRAHVKNLIQIRAHQLVGSGYLLTGDGYFITNDHVLPKKTVEPFVYINKVSLPFPVQRTLVRSKLHDLVLAQIPLYSSCSPSVAIADQRAEEGDPVRTYSFCGDKALRSHGNIIDIGGSFNRLLDFCGLGDNIQSRAIKNTQYSDCAIRFGWSGGPVISENTGELVGITKSIGYFLDLSSCSLRQYHGFSSSVIVRKMINYFLDGQAK